jgi:hypothetical protein
MLKACAYDVCTQSMCPRCMHAKHVLTMYAHKACAHDVCTQSMCSRCMHTKHVPTMYARKACAHDVCTQSMCSRCMHAKHVLTMYAHKACAQIDIAINLYFRAHLLCRHPMWNIPYKICLLDHSHASIRKLIYMYIHTRIHIHI